MHTLVCPSVGGCHLCVRSCFSSSARYVVFILLRLFLRWVVHGRTTAVLWDKHVNFGYLREKTFLYLKRHSIVLIYNKYLYIYLNTKWVTKNSHVQLQIFKTSISTIYCAQKWNKIICLVSLFNIISTFVGYLMLKPSLLKDSSGTI